MQHPVAILLPLGAEWIVAGASPARWHLYWCGVDIRHERVTRIAGTSGDWRLVTPQREYHASYLVIAAGARNSLRAQFLSPISPSDLMVTAGYFIPGRCSLMQIRFLQGITGYIWVFPRADHVSAGIAGKMGETTAAELRRILERCSKNIGSKRTACLWTLPALLAHSSLTSRPDIRQARSL